ncbi:ATP-binding protein [Loktanella sp. SALINAS62]|uniref:sensor histidine kinase n=1 Tax=Loktanella sp. SALINAS62 TaxID=2706124 RepID=UPI001B8DA521|nr:ATP-binding protein [Loktanella sp. SALINAS62]MBS1302868.1 two-component sensor histidine kinase [Loktanella sp. SALINAS62]
MPATVPVDALPVPVMLIGPDQIVAAVSPSLADVLGPRLAGRHYVTALRQPPLLDAIEDAFRSQNTRQSQFLGRDGARDTTWGVTITPHRGTLILTFDDRTAAHDVGQLRRDFVANVSHELRTPLTALQGFIETLRGAARDDAQARERFLAIMERETTRMTQLVDDLLSLSRVEENERLRPNAAINLGQLVSATLEDLGPVIEQSGLSVTLSDESAGVHVLGDSNQLRQVIVNLVQNALKYGSDGGRIALRIDPPSHFRKLRGDGLALHVTDYGRGIAPHHLPRLTERFYRVDSHRSRGLGGTGLGLAIVKHILNRHRGRLTISSTLGQGTTCTVILPLAD